MPTRRELIAALGATVATGALGSRELFAEGSSAPIVKPPRLSAGDVAGLVNPARAVFRRETGEVHGEAVAALGLEVRRGENYWARRGYLAGSDEERAADINGFFADPEVRALWATGGWGSARVLPHLDYGLIRRNPKVVVGFSDATALLLAIHARTGLVTFHGPIPRKRVSADWQRRLLFEAEAPILEAPVEIKDHETVQTEHRIRTISPGRARGRLAGGNLAVLSGLVGSSYLPDWRGRVLFLEDVREQVYRVDRMLTQLRLAGILDQISGFVFGECTRCDPGDGYGSLTLEEVLDDHLAPLGIPAFQGAMVGHIEEQFTLPIGAEAEIDADRGSIRILESAVR